MGKIFNKITNWEAWPFKLLYAPIAPMWIYYMLRSRAVWFFTPSNPKITFGGMEGEGKKEMYELLPKEYYPKTVFIEPKIPFGLVLEKISATGIEYPFVVKPDVASQGVLFRKIDNENELKVYHSKMEWEYIVQSMVTYGMEMSVFYIRHPQEKSGRITGFLHKVPLHVIGDGKSSLQELVLRHHKAGERIEQLKTKHLENWDKIIPQGEKYMLSHAGNHNRGASFIDLKKEIDDRLLSLLDEISIGIDDFFYGRYDIIASNVEDLKQRKNFAILEYNGCGAEPNHFYDTGYTLIGAYKEILKHWKWLYKISAYNAKQGIKPWPYKKGKAFLAEARKLFWSMKALDEVMP